MKYQVLKELFHAEVDYAPGDVIEAKVLGADLADVLVKQGTLAPLEDEKTTTKKAPQP